MNGGYRSMAESVGEGPDRPLTFVVGEDFDPYDEDEVASVRLACEIDSADRAAATIKRLQAENELLRARVRELDPDSDDMSTWDSEG